MFSRKKSNKLKPVLSVSELTDSIKDVIETAFDSVLVVGEVSNAKVYPSGHWYFSMKDQDATISCVCFKQANQYIKFKLEDGLQIIAKGKLSVYPPRGGYQLVVTGIEPVGIGEWQLAFEQLRQKLENEGLLAPERKRPIPMLPQKVGVVTSPAGAALHDILNTLNRRNKSVEVIISPAKVQGEGSAESVASAILLLQAIDDLDVIIVARGGGSIEDLWSFNTEIVARAVISSSVPVISGVGHETDVTICDLVADLRAPTPTAAAELVAKGYTELQERFRSLKKHLSISLDQRLGLARRRLDRLNVIPKLLRFEDRIKHKIAALAHKRKDALSSLEKLLTKNKHRHIAANEKLTTLGPKNVMNRGFSIIRKLDDGQVIRSFAQVKQGDTLEGLLLDGKLYLEVKETDSNWSQEGEGK